MIEIGNQQYRRLEITDADGEILLTIERLPSGNVMVEGRIYGRDGQLLVTIDPDGVREVGPASVMLGGGPPG
ncbi:MAG: hypothetical protein HYY03_03425 [Chloroflexi bacterium]|nr:hypothetical protein [Chloroflexota bacterium]